MTPETRYARNGTINLAYQVLGDANRQAPDIVVVSGFVSHVAQAWRLPLLARFLRGLSTFSRVIVFDRRSMGMSDRDPLRKAPSLDERVADIRTVMKAAASPRAALLGHSEGGPACLQLAASYPEQVSALILHATSARFSVSPNFPHGISPQFMKLGIEVHQELGSGRGFELLAPSLGSDSTARRRWAAYERLAAALDEITGSLRMLLELDLRHLLPCIRAPTLIAHAANDMVVPVDCSRYTASQIRGAQYLELAGADHLFWAGNQDQLIAAVERFLAKTPDGYTLRKTRRRRRKGQPASGWDSLTATELQVAALVLDGLTNPQIAQRLYISPRTVQTHLVHIFAKLHVSRRSEVAAQAAHRLDSASVVK